MTTYRYNYPTSKRHIIRQIFVVLAISIIVLSASATAVIFYTHQKQAVIKGSTLQIPQKVANQPVPLMISEPTFTMQLPGDWKQTDSQDTSTVHSISWQATAKDADNRYLTIYIDTIPTTYAVNKELPVAAHGSQLTYGALSDNCSDFTPGGTTNAAIAETLKPVASVWQGVSFICNLPQFIDNQIGTGSSSGVNSVTLTGPKTGTHSYFFLYIDRNVNPDYTIIENALQSFRAL